MKRYSFLQTPDAVIKAESIAQCPNGYHMRIRDEDEWAAIAAAVNQGIDEYLEAITERSTFDSTTGNCLVHPEELHVLLRRLANNEAGHDLRSSILSTLEIEEV